MFLAGAKPEDCLLKTDEGKSIFVGNILIGILMELSLKVNILEII